MSRKLRFRRVKKENKMKLKRILFIILAILMLTITVQSAIAELQYQDTRTVLYYSFDDVNVENTDPLDLTSNNYHGNSTNINTGAGGKINESFNFTGTSKVVVPNSAITLGTDDHTISYWINLPSLAIGGSMIFLEQQSGSDTNRYINYFSDAPNDLVVYTENEGTLTYEITQTDTWYHIVVTRSGTTMELIVNNVSQGTDTHADWNSAGVFELGEEPATDDTNLKGRIDEFVIFDEVLTDQEIGYLYANFSPNVDQQYPFVLLDQAPTITLLTPGNGNNTHLANTTVNVTFLMTNDNASHLTNCTVAIDASTRTFTDITNNTIIWQSATSLTQGNHTFYATCTDSGGTTTDGTYKFVYDTTSPVITQILPYSTNNTVYYSNINLTMNFTTNFTDNYVFAYNVTAYYPNGSLWWANWSYNITADYTTINFSNIDVNITGNVEGNYTVYTYVEDDHTANTIGQYTHTKDLATTELAFKTDRGYHITTKLKSSTIPLADIDVFRHQDRYSYTYYMNDLQYPGQTYEYVFKLSASDQVYYRGMSSSRPYPSFVVGTHWVDFNLDTNKAVYYEVKPAGNNDGYEIYILTEEINLAFNSIGGLNNATNSYQFEIENNDAPNITSTSPIGQQDVYYGNQIVFDTTVVDDEGESLTYKYYWDGTLNNTGDPYTFDVPNSTGLHNMTVNVTDPHGQMDTYKWIVNITSLPPFMTFTAKDLWDDSVITTFSAGITNNDGGNTAGYNDSGLGTITTNISTLIVSVHNVTVAKTGWFNNTFNVQSNLNTSWTAYIYQNIINLNCYDEQDNNITCDQTTIYPDNGELEANISATGYYNRTATFNASGLINTTINVTGFYNKQIYLRDSDTNQTITGLTCTIDGTAYTGNPLNISTTAYTTKNLSCYKTLAYPVHTWTLNDTQEIRNYTMTEYKVNLYFSATTNITLTDINQQQNVTNTQVIIKQSDFPIGPVVVRWNEGTQVMEYYNYKTSSLTAYLQVVSNITASKTFKILGDGAVIENARVVAEDWNGTDYNIVYGKLSDDNGEVILYMQPDKDYRITVQATGYITKQTIHPSRTSDTSIRTIDLNVASAGYESASITDCASILHNANNCTFQHLCGTACSTINITITYYYNDSTNTTTSTLTSTTTGTSETYELTENVNLANVRIYEDGTLVDTINITMDRLSAYNKTLPFDTSIILGSDRNNRIWIIAILLIGIILAGVFEVKVRKDSGVYTAGLWYMLWGLILPVFMVIAIVLGFFKITLIIYQRVNTA